MTDPWTDRLSEYLDGDLDAATAAALEAHLGGCDDCSATLGELRAVVARAGSLPERAPATDLWPGIAAAIGAVRVAQPVVLDLQSARRQRVQRRLSLSVPQLVAAGIAVMIMSGAGVWLLRPDGGAAPRGPIAVVPARVAPSASTILATDLAAPAYDAAVADLQNVLAEGRASLDTTTVRVLEENLRLIDQAIEESRRALAADPASEYLNVYLADSMRRKLDLLRTAGHLIRAQS